MEYTVFNLSNPHCIHAFLSDRAYASIITETVANGDNETGGVLLGYIYNRGWFIVDAIDPGIKTVKNISFLQWDKNYVNYQIKRISRIYNYPLTVLGIWHRHPGSMDRFSMVDEKTISENLKGMKHGMLSMLVNIDPDLRMTFYHCHDTYMMPLKYDVGDKYFPEELLQYADSNTFSKRYSVGEKPFRVKYDQTISFDRVKEIVADGEKNETQNKNNWNDTHIESGGNNIGMELAQVRNELEKINEILRKNSQISDRVQLAQLRKQRMRKTNKHNKEIRRSEGQRIEKHDNRS